MMMGMASRKVSLLYHVIPVKAQKQKSVYLQEASKEQDLFNRRGSLSNLMRNQIFPVR